MGLVAALLPWRVHWLHLHGGAITELQCDLRVSTCWFYLSQGVPLHVLHGSLLVLLLQGVKVWLVEERGAGVDRVVLQVRGRASASVHRRPEAGLLQDLCTQKHTRVPGVKAYIISVFLQQKVLLRRTLRSRTWSSVVLRSEGALWCRLTFQLSRSV